MAKLRDKPRSEPYKCHACTNERGCGAMGILRFPGDPVPVCKHHDQPITMEPSRPKRDG
jgi:hypothetical protein